MNDAIFFILLSHVSKSRVKIWNMVVLTYGDQGSVDSLNTLK